MSPEMDLILEVDDSIFPANALVLSAHSGYFRQAISQLIPGQNRLRVPSVIPSDYFGLLISAMYHPQGVLNFLNSENVYQILLYAQLLEMPVATEQCRSFLALTSRPQKTLATLASDLASHKPDLSPEEVPRVTTNLKPDPTLEIVPQEAPRKPETPLLVRPIASRLNFLGSSTSASFFKPNYSPYADFSSRSFFSIKHQRSSFLKGFFSSLQPL